MRYTATNVSTSRPSGCRGVSHAWDRRTDVRYIQEDLYCSQGAALGTYLNEIAADGLVLLQRDRSVVLRDELQALQGFIMGTTQQLRTTNTHRYPQTGWFCPYSAYL